ncbi:MAG: methyltransferase domain-containing protein [Hyphomonadaceae bacterium]|nr:methyltransferase domain-containing protein [Hyphomonadaceae bacterium]
MSFYSRYILPPLIDCACGAKPIRRQRAKIIPKARGVVLELGFGSGLNAQFYDPARVAKVYALEPEPGMVERAERAAARSAVPIQVMPEPAEALSLPDASVDTVVVTYALCTIPDPAAALAGARRALKPGGVLLFCEHGLAPDPEVSRTQRFVEPLWKRIAGGCHLTREPVRLIEGAGFEIRQKEALYLPSTPRFAGFNTWGEAVVA